MRNWRSVAMAAGAAVLLTGLPLPAAHADGVPPGLPQVARLSCGGRVDAGVAVAACEWSLRVDAPGHVELWRGTGEDGALTRVKVFETSDPTVHRFVDNGVQVGMRYGYVLVVFGRGGIARGVSNISRVSFAERELEHLRLACRRVERVVHCEWAAPTAPAANKLVLWATVDGGARRKLVTLQPPTAGAFNFRIPPRAHRVRFAVVSYNAADEVVGRSVVVSIAVTRHLVR